MNIYQVLFTPKAEEDILESYEWGVSQWGRERAEFWMRALNAAIFERLTKYPMSCPPAPESRSASREVRHLVLDRYRIIFEISGTTVIVLRLTGPFNNLGSATLDE